MGRKTKGNVTGSIRVGVLDLKKYCVEDFTIKGIADEEESTSLKLVLDQCYEFVNEETLIQEMVQKMGAKLEQLP